MINILYPVCKSDNTEYKYFAPFLNRLSDHLAGLNINLTYLLFSRHFIDYIKSKIAILGEDCLDESKSISEFENEYDFSFKAILYSDLLQTSEFVVKTRDRNWYIPDKEFIEKDIYKNKLNQIAELFRNNKYSFVFSDQTPDFEQSFIQYVCIKNNIPFIRYLGNFINRGFFMSFSKERNGKIVDADISTIDKNAIQTFVNNYRNGKKSNIYNLNENNLKLYEPSQQPLWKRLINKKPKDYLFSSEIRLKDFYIKRVEKGIKAFYYDNYDKNEKYIYYGLHLTTESHIALESYPYINQINVIELISRALPFGYTLYVKPHPWWAHTIGLNSLKQIKKIPSVKVIHPNIPIKTIIKNSGGIVTLNATTGVEALILGKPVVALSVTNSYTQYHPNAELCTNLYDLPRMISKMIKTKVAHDTTIEYLSKMFSYTSDVRLESDRFLSVEDAEKKAVKFAKCIEIVIKQYSKNLK